MIRALVLLLIVTMPVQADPKGTDAETFFELKIRPVLAGTCGKCHGEKKASNGLRLDSRDALLKGGKHGPAVVAGDPAKSLLIQVISRTHDDIAMPPDKRLPGAVVADFASWVKDGAPWPQARAIATTRHWAFEPVKKIEPPADPSGWAEHPIDRIIIAKLREAGLQPVGPADKRTLLRRVTFDLTGLPPTPAEVEAFLADDSPEAFAKVVDRLLASRHYGERWGRHWMDIARYADTAGDNADYPIPEIRLYRDYIIDSFNADKPYDQFVREQLAGDILAKHGPRDKYAERLAATGFLALSRRYATAPYELWHLTLEDAIDTTGRAFMGLTLRCARCHDHKFDPTTQEDYYALYGIFASTQFPWAGAEEFASQRRPREHFVPLVPAGEAAQRLAAHQQSLQTLEEEIKHAEKASAEKRKRLDDLLWNLRRPGLPAELPGAYAVQEGQAVDVPLQIRGEPDRPGPVVKRDVPNFLRNGQELVNPAGSSGRLQLAEWLTDPKHPLTARVMVNRIWQHHFGKGLVGTPSNFGLRGEEPTHPELLDWLAAKFVESGWSIKAMHRLILTSKTYQLSSGTPSSAHRDPRSVDPGNRLYWRHDRRRLGAEAIRDSLLAVSGRLDRQRPGPHPFPPITQWGWTQHTPFKDVYPSNHRSVYLMTQRFQRHPYLALFDGPDTNTTTDLRTSSTVPLQALFVMNSPFLTEQGEGLARRLMSATTDPATRIALAYEWAYARPATAEEIERGIRYVKSYVQELGKAGVPADRREVETWTSFARIVLSANEFVYVD